MKKLPENWLRYGVELTALPKRYREDRDGDATIETTDHIEALAVKWGDNYEDAHPNDTPHCDNHCFEVSSSVFTTPEEAIKFHRRFTRFCNANRLSPRYHRDKTVCGGGHQTYDMPADAPIQRHWRKVANLYFLPWIFSMPDDTDSCNNFGDHGIKHRDAMRGLLVLKHKNQSITELIDESSRAKHTYSYVRTDRQRKLVPLVDSCEPDLLFHFFSNDTTMGSRFYPTHDYLVGTRRLGASASGYGLEYRFFEAPMNAKEFKLQLAFGNALTRYLWETRRTDERYVFRSNAQLMKITPAQAIRDFRKLCRKLKLNWQDYAVFIRRNLRPRWELDRERL
jgi:hypothetical protein